MKVVVSSQVAMGELGRDDAFNLELPVDKKTGEVQLPDGHWLPAGGLALMAEVNEWEMFLTLESGVTITGGEDVAEWLRANIDPSFCGTLVRALKEIQNDFTDAAETASPLAHSANPVERGVVIERLLAVSSLLSQTAMRMAAPTGRKRPAIADYSQAARAAGKDVTSSAFVDFSDHNLGKGGEAS